LKVRSEYGLLALAAAILANEARGQNCPTRPYWPTTEWRSRADEVKVTRAAEIKALEDYAFSVTSKEPGLAGVRVAGFLIVKNGEIIYERYALGADASKRQNYMGFGRTVVGALTGVAVAHGALTLDDSVCAHLDGVRSDNCSIEVHHLLDMESGIDWQESHVGAAGALDPVQHCSAAAMGFGEGRADMARFVLNHPRRDEPGATWQYSNGDGAVLSAVIVSAMNPQHGEHWPWTLLLDRIGAGNSVFTRDPKGALVHWIASLRDLARFGFLYLNDGCWDGARLLPAGWVAASRTVPEGFKRKRIVELWGTEVAGRSWMVNQAVPEQGLTKSWPNLPDDAFFMAGGFDGTAVFGSQSLDLLIAIWGDSFDGNYDMGRMVDMSLAIAR
jgi:CubicO group peptidase (beta-lactamase class C family)